MKAVADCKQQSPVQQPSLGLGEGYETPSQVALCSKYVQDKLPWQTLDTNETCMARPQCEPPSDLQHREDGPVAAM